jgi:cytochrome c oxidase assembly factor CtaG
VGGMTRLTFSIHNTFTYWGTSAFPLAVDAVLVLVAAWYLRADWRLAERGRRWRPSRTAAFMSGLLATALAFQSSIAGYSGTYFQAHVMQHLLLMVVAPPLLALGAPSTLLLQTASHSTKERWLHLLRSGPFAALSHPVTVAFLYFGTMFVFFLTSLLSLAMHHMVLMDLINLTFLFGATLYWWPLVGLDPILHWKMDYGQRMMILLVSSGVEAFLGVAILMSSKPVAPFYTLASTHAGGALLWVAADVVNVGAFLPIFWQWMRSEDRAAVRADARLSRLEPGMPMSPGVEFDPDHVLTAWEAAWVARTGTVPSLQRNPHSPPPPTAARSQPD